MKTIDTKTKPVGGARKRMGQQGVVNALGAAILRGDYKAGANLPNEADLTARFSVSRTVIREVMKTLAAKGLVIAKTKIGTRVAAQTNWNVFDTDVLAWRVQAGVDVAFLRQLYEIRLAMEPMAAALAAEHRSEADVAKLREILAEMAEPDHTHASFYAADVDFHLTLVRASGNPFMVAIGEIIKAAINAKLTTNDPPVGNPARQRSVVATHSAVVDAIEVRDARAARRAMIEVVDDGIQDRGGSLQNLPT